MNVGVIVRVHPKCVPEDELLVGQLVAIRSEGGPFKTHYQVELTERSHQLYMRYTPRVETAHLMPSLLWISRSKLTVL